MTSTKFQNIRTKWEKNKLRHKGFFEFQIKILILSILVISNQFLQNTFAQDYTRWKLPEGAKLRLGKGSVGNITFSPDGNRLIVESSMGIWVYDTHTGTELNLIAENPSNILGVSPDASMYVIRGLDNTIQLRNITDGSLKVTLKGNTEDIHLIAFSPDGRMLAGARDKNIHLWNLTTGEQNATLEGHTEWIVSIVFSPDGTTLASRSYDNTLRLWDVATATHKTTLSKYMRGIHYLLFSPDGNTLISGDTNYDVQVWDVNTGQKKKDFDALSLLCIAISPDGSTLATGGFSGLHLWNVATGTHIAELGRSFSWVFSVAFSPDGSTLASGGRDELYLWDVESRTRKMSIDGHRRGVSGMAISPNGNILATSSWENIHLWDPITGEYKKLIYGRGWLTSHWDLVFSPDGSTLASLAFGAIHLWDVSSTTHLAALTKWYGHGQKSTSTETQGYQSIIFSPDGKFIAAAHADKTVHLWYMGRTYIDALKGHTDVVTSIAFSRDNRTLVSGSYDGTVRFWDFTSGSNIDTFSGHTDKVHSVAFNPDESIVASGSEDNTIILWDVTTGNPRIIHTEHTNGIHQLTFSNDGKTLLSCGNWEDPIIQIWDVATGELITNITAHTRGDPIVVFSPDGRTLISGSRDSTILLWDYTSLLGTENEIQQLAEDVNRDGSINLQDLISVASQFGQPGNDNAADVNEDGVINIADILLVAAALANENGAPSINSVSDELIPAAEVEQWLSQTWRVNTNIPKFQKGIAVLEQLLSVLTPEKTALLSNYPNPFNPETWIPYQLAKPADVTLRIYATDGQLVRTLVLGNQPVGNYQNRNKAAHWDGKNEFGEPVASGVYFYTLSAGNFTSTRRMVIRK
ncbi:MAG: T9SS type A sorting domain-containing protein [Candidatus Poribacteria bacterium]|nr:T9SS type A sorting domain-containing protein [Candidatus Poribacteria bacterium]